VYRLNLDVSVLIQDNLKVSEQCTKTCNRVLDMIKRSFTFRSGNMIVTLYKSLIIYVLSFYLFGS